VAMGAGVDVPGRTGGVPLERRAELVLDARADLGEGPVWDPADDTLLWVDIDAGAVHRFSPATGAETTLDAGQPVGAVAWRRSGGLALAMRDGFGLLDPEPGATVRLVAPVEADRSDQRMNDGRCDRRGRFWAGTTSVLRRPRAGRLYRLHPDGRVEPVLSGVSMSNGLDWSPDDRRLYYVDSATEGVDRYAADPETGRVGARTRLVEIPRSLGIPDGLTVDADGCVWLALWGAGAVHRYTPAGVLDRVVRLPVSRPTSCTFGGAGLDVLYVTSAAAGLSARELARQPGAGGLFAVRPGVQGLPARGFAG